MGLGSILNRIFGKAPQERAKNVDAPSEPEVIIINRFEGADDTRWNRGQFNDAHGQSINNDLATKLSTLQARCALEYARNPMFAGVVNTFKDDVVGSEGPTLQVTSDSEAFNDAVEAAWRAVFADPEPSRKFGGPEIMKTWVGGLLLAGSYVNVTASVKRTSTVATLGWRSIHARRLVTPAGMAGDPSVAFGYRVDSDGAPIEYFIDKQTTQYGFSLSGIDYETVPAAAVQHVFIPIEAEQLTGAPMLSSSLQTAADLRQLDRYVLESQKNSAANTPGLEAKDPQSMADPDPTPTSGSLCYEPGQVPVAPKGWGWTALQATQPSAQYLDYRREKLSELGRPIHMPLLVVLLTAAEANFSSAQYEGSVYGDGVRMVQSLIERRSLNPFALAIVAELALRGRVRVPRSFDLVWTHNVPAHANIEKLVKALRMMVEDGLISPSRASAILGFNWEKEQAARAKCNQALDAAELPRPPVNAGNSPPEPDGDNSNSPQPGGRKSVSRFSFAA